MIQHLLQRDQPFGLETDIDNNMLVRDLDNGSGNDGLFGSQILGGGALGRLLAVEVRQRRGKIGCIVIRLGACMLLLLDGASGQGRFRRLVSAEIPPLRFQALGFPVRCSGVYSRLLRIGYFYTHWCVAPEPKRVHPNVRAVGGYSSLDA